MRVFIVIAALCLACYGAVDKKAKIAGLIKSLQDVAENHENELRLELQYKVALKMAQAKSFGEVAVYCISDEVEEFKEAVEKAINESGLPAFVNRLKQFAIEIAWITNLSDKDLDEYMKEYETLSTIEFQWITTDADTRATIAGLAFARKANQCMHN